MLLSIGMCEFLHNFVPVTHWLFSSMHNEEYQKLFQKIRTMFNQLFFSVQEAAALFYNKTAAEASQSHKYPCWSQIHAGHSEGTRMLFLVDVNQVTTDSKHFKFAYL